MQQDRCGACENCCKLEKVRKSVLRAVNPPLTSLGRNADDAILVWNRMVAELPCLAVKSETK